MSEIVISRFDPTHLAEWVEFLRSSNDGTLFHDPRFLDYHPAGRFEFEHLLARRGKSLIAVIPGAIVRESDGIYFTSTAGASVGGPATRPKMALSEATDLIRSLQEHAVARGWAGVRMTIAPLIYHQNPSQTLLFALAREGFVTTEQRLTFAIPLQATAEENRFERLFRATSANEVRAARRRGVTVAEGGLDLLPEFLPMWSQTYARLEAHPTHSAEELRDLLHRFPDRVRIYCARREKEAIAATFVFLLNDVVAYSFYHVMNPAYARENGQKVAFAEMIDRLANAGYHWLDLGPSASLQKTNDSVAFFKEGLGAVGYVRSTSLWKTPSVTVST